MVSLHASSPKKAKVSTTSPLPRPSSTRWSQVSRGNTLPVSGSFSGIGIAYLPTDRDLGVLIEIFSGMPDDE